MRAAYISLVNLTAKGLTGGVFTPAQGTIITGFPTEVGPNEGNASFSIKAKNDLSPAQGSAEFDLFGKGDVKVAFYIPADPTQAGTYTATVENHPEIKCPSAPVKHQGAWEIHTFTFSTEEYPYANWMSNHLASGDIGGHTMYSILLPGSHDSGTGSLDTTEIAPSASDWLKEAEKIVGPERLKKVGADWAVTQEPSAGAPSGGVTGQLLWGCRYLDIRTCYDAQRDALRLVHSFYGNNTDTFLAEVAEFLARYPDEFVVLDFNHFYEMGKAQHNQLVSLISKHFGGKMVTKSQFNRNLGDLQKTSSRCYVTYHDTPIAEAHDFLLYGNQTWSPWPNTYDMGVTVEKWNEYIAKREVDHPGVLFILQGIRTPDSELIIQGLSDPKANIPRSIESLEMETTKYLCEILRGDTVPKGALNIVMVDWFVGTPIPALCMQRNRKLGISQGLPTPASLKDGLGVDLSVTVGADLGSVAKRGGVERTSLVRVPLVIAIGFCLAICCVLAVWYSLIGPITASAP